MSSKSPVGVFYPAYSSWATEPEKKLHDSLHKEYQARLEINDQPAILRAHPLEKPLSGFLLELEEDLKVVEYSKEFGGDTDIELALRKKIQERLIEYFDDLPLEEIEQKMELITLKAWPVDWSSPDDVLYIQGKENRFIILLSFVTRRQLTAEQREAKIKEIEIQRKKRESAINMKNMSRYHSRRK